MKKRLVAIGFVLLGVSAPVQATGGFVCRTAGANPILVSVGFGHVPGAPLLQDSTRLVENGRNVPVSAPQWWLDDSELRLLLADPNAMRRELILKAKRNGPVYDGSLWRHGRKRWVRCREG